MKNMEKLIAGRLTELREKHRVIETEIHAAQQLINNKLAQLNGVKGAIGELEFLLESNIDSGFSAD